MYCKWIIRFCLFTTIDLWGKSFCCSNRTMRIFGKVIETLPRQVSHNYLHQLCLIHPATSKVRYLLPNLLIWSVPAPLAFLCLTPTGECPLEGKNYSFMTIQCSHLFVCQQTVHRWGNFLENKKKKITKNENERIKKIIRHLCILLFV